MLKSGCGSTTDWLQYEGHGLFQRTVCASVAACARRNIALPNHRDRYARAGEEFSEERRDDNLLEHDEKNSRSCEQNDEL